MRPRRRPAPARWSGLQETAEAVDQAPPIVGHRVGEPTVDRALTARSPRGVPWSLLAVRIDWGAHMVFASSSDEVQPPSFGEFLMRRSRRRSVLSAILALV